MIHVQICKRLKSILNQDVLKIEPRITEERQVRNVPQHKVKNLFPRRKKKVQKNKGKARSQCDGSDHESSTEHGKAPIQSRPKRRRGTTPDEVVVLQRLEMYTNEHFPEEVLKEIQQKNWHRMGH